MSDWETGEWLDAKALTYDEQVVLLGKPIADLLRNSSAPTTTRTMRVVHIDVDKKTITLKGET